MGRGRKRLSPSLLSRMALRLQAHHKEVTLQKVRTAHGKASACRILSVLAVNDQTLETYWRSKRTCVCFVWSQILLVSSSQSRGHAFFCGWYRLLGEVQWVACFIPISETKESIEWAKKAEHNRGHESWLVSNVSTLVPLFPFSFSCENFCFYQWCFLSAIILNPSGAWGDESY